MDADHVAVAEQSFHRCLTTPDFLRAFYDRFLASDPRIAPLFRDTALDRQTKLLQHALGLLFVYAKHGDVSLLERVAERHSHRELDIPAELYAVFLDSLVATVAERDPEFAPEVGDAWRAALTPGIDLMIGKYD